MNRLEKYSNITEVLPGLQKVLLDSIQGEVLEIKKVKLSCEKFEGICTKFPKLKEAQYVIYSPFIAKSHHAYESFIFLDEVGNEMCHVSGQDMALYGLLEPCQDLMLSEDYQDAQLFSNS